MLWIYSNKTISRDVLDYGCGKGFDFKFYGIDGYDPYYYPKFPEKKYDFIMCNFVLNVVEEKERQEIISNVKSLLKTEGTAFFTVRRDIKKEGLTSRGTEQWNVCLDMNIVFENNDFCIYEFKNERA